VLLVAAVLTALLPLAPWRASAAAPAATKAGCTIVGTAGPDVLVGTSGDDVICGRGGDDRLTGKGGDDELRGGRGDDEMFGGPGADLLRGESGKDSLTGGRGDDYLRGGRNDDRLDGRDAPGFHDLVRCGPGEGDEAFADPLDDVVSGCEVVNQNDPPTDIKLNPSSVPENAPAGTLVGKLSATDPDQNDKHTFTLVAGPGSADNAFFVINGRKLRTAASFDFETKATLSIRVRAKDKVGESFAKALTVTVTDVFENAAPVAVDDTRTTTEDTVLTLPLSAAGSPAANDTDADGDALAVTAVSGAVGGTAAIVSGSVRFTPTANLCGQALGHFDYTVTDTHSGTDQGRVTVDISCVPDDPTASDDAATVAEDAGATAVAVLGNDNDPDGDALTINSATQPAHGTVVVTGGGSGLTYEPDPDYCNNPPGTTPDTFTYTLTPGGDTATVSMTVTCQDDAPVAVDDALTVTEDDVATLVDVRANDTDVDGGPKTIVSVTQPTHGTVLVTTGGLGVTYEPDADYCNNPPGSTLDTFTYTLTPGGDTATVTVTVDCVQDDPVAVDDSATVGEDSGATAVDVLANDTDVDGGPKSVDSVTQPANGTVVITGGGTGLTYEPDAGYCNNPPGTTLDTFTYTLTPGGDTATVSVTVTCDDDPPTAVDDTATVDEDDVATAVDVLTNDTDLDGGPKSVQSVTQPANGTVAITGGGAGLTYQPDPNYCNDPPGTTPDTFTYTLNGGSTATVSITVSCVDDDPVAVDDSATVPMNNGATAVGVLANDTDVDGGPKSVQSVTQPVNGTVVITGGGTGLTYEPDAAYCNDGSPVDTFTYTLNGGSTATVSVTVPCDAPPVAVDDSATVNEDSGATAVDVLTNDTDTDGGPKAIDLVSQPANGTVVITGGGTGLTYEPDPNYCNNPPGTTLDTFTYTLTPGGDTATVSMTVTCVDDAPVAVDDNATVGEDSGATSVGVLANDTDVDGGPKSVASVTQPANGTVVITGGGTGLTYEPDPNYCNNPPGTTPDTFTYDLNGGDTGSVSMTVTCVNDAPVADDETFNAANSAVGNTALVVDDPTDGPPSQSDPKKSISGDILAGDTDVDGPGPLTVTPGTFATNDGGSVTIEADGDFVYAPAAATSCTDSSDFFTYTVEDSGSPEQTDTGQVTIAIAGCVWYVSNNAVGNAGTSTAPFDTLAQAETASAAGHTIFVYDGDNTTAGYSAGITLKANQVLTSEAADLVVGGVTLNSAVAGARPTLTDNNADVVELDDNNTVRGFVIDPQGTGGGIAGALGDTGGGTMDDVVVNDTGTAGQQPGLDLDQTTGTFNVSSLSVTTTGATGIRLSSAGTVNFQSSGTVVVTTSGAKALDATGTSLGTSTFDSLTVTGSGVGAVSMVNTTGSTTFGDLALTTTSGATGAFVLNNAGTVTLPAGATANVSATGGPGVDVIGAASLSFDDVDSANSTTDGISLESFGTGTFSAGSGSTITGTSGAGDVGFDLDGGNGAVTYDGTVSTSGSARPVEVTNRTGATADFNGVVTSTGAGVNLTTNGAGTIRFDGGLTLTTTTNDAFTATGGGTVAVTDPNATGTVPDNTAATTTGRALNVANTTIHGDGLTFRSISSNGAVNGILLNGTGTSGGLTVTGNGGSCTSAANCSGGAIQASTQSGVLLTSTSGTSLTRMHIQTSNEDGIEGSSVTGLNLTQSVITNNGDDSEDVGVGVDNLWGTSAWSAVSVTQSELANVMIDNTSGTLDSFTVAGASHFDTLGTAFGGNSVLIEMRGTAVMTSGSIDGATFVDNKPARGITVQSQGTAQIGDSSTNSFTLQNSTFTNNGLQASFEQSGSANLTFRMLNNGSAIAPMTMPNTAVGTSHAVNVASSSTSTGGTIRGRISGNFIGNSAVAGSGSAIGNGIRALIQGKTVATLLLDSNTIRQVPQARGIDVQVLGPLDNSGVAASDITVTNNDVNPQDSTGFPASAIYVAADSQGGGTVTLRADIRGNTVPAGAAVDSLPSFIGLDEVVAAAVCQLVDTAPASANATAQLTSTNTGSASAAAGCALIAGPIGTPP
jgi:hypothetical protein